MPSEAFAEMSDQDLGAAVAYLQTALPVDRDVPKADLKVIGRVVEALFQPFLNALVQDHTAPSLVSPVPGPTAEYGRYLGIACRSCHGDQLQGGSQDTPDLLTSKTLGPYDEAQFFKTMRTGVAADHREMDPDLMPWTTYRNMTEDELRAVWLYLQEGPGE